MNIQCFFRGQRAVFQGLDKKTNLYRLKLESGKITYIDELSKIQEFKDHTEQEKLFSG